MSTVVELTPTSSNVSKHWRRTGRSKREQLQDIIARAWGHGGLLSVRRSAQSAFSKGQRARVQRRRQCGVSSGWKVEYTETALAALRKPRQASAARRIMDYLDAHIVGQMRRAPQASVCKGPLAGLWRYRVATCG